MRLLVRQEPFSFYLLGFLVSFLLSAPSPGVRQGDVKLRDVRPGVGMGEGLLALRWRSLRRPMLWMMATAGRGVTIPFGPHLAAEFCRPWMGGGIIG